MEVSGQLHISAALPPGKEPAVPIAQEARWAPEPVCAPAGIQTPTPRPYSPSSGRYTPVTTRTRVTGTSSESATVHEYLLEAVLIYS
jgi:hypothetical protein